MDTLGTLMVNVVVNANGVGPALDKVQRKTTRLTTRFKLLQTRSNTLRAGLYATQGSVTSLASSMLAMGPAGAVVAIAFLGIIKLSQKLMTFTKKAVMTFAEFESTLFAAASAMDNISDASVKQLSSSILELSDTTRFSSQEVAAGAKAWLQAGNSLDDFQRKGGKAITTLASIADIKPKEAATSVVAMMKSFDSNTDDLEHFNDVLAAAFTNTPASVKDITKSLSFVGTVAKQTGADFEETVGIVSQLRGQFGASQIGTGLRSALLGLQSPSRKAKKAMEGLGLSWEKIRDEKSILSVVAQLNEAGAKTSDLADIFTTRSIPIVQAMQAIEKRDPGALKKFGEQLKETSSGLAEAMQVFQDSALGRQFEIIGAKVQTLWTKIGEGARPAIAAFQAHISELIEALSDPDVINGFVKLATLALNLASAFIRAGTFVAKWAGKMRGAIDNLAPSVRLIMDLVTDMMRLVNLLGIVQLAIKHIGSIGRDKEQEAADRKALKTAEDILNKKNDLAKITAGAQGALLDFEPKGEENSAAEKIQKAMADLAAAMSKNAAELSRSTDQANAVSGLKDRQKSAVQEIMSAAAPLIKATADMEKARASGDLASMTVEQLESALASRDSMRSSIGRTFLAQGLSDQDASAVLGTLAEILPEFRLDLDKDLMATQNAFADLAAEEEKVRLKKHMKEISRLQEIDDMENAIADARKKEATERRLAAERVEALNRAIGLGMQLLQGDFLGLANSIGSMFGGTTGAIVQAITAVIETLAPHLSIGQTSDGTNVSVLDTFKNSALRQLESIAEALAPILLAVARGFFVLSSVVSSVAAAMESNSVLQAAMSFAGWAVVAAFAAIGLAVTAVVIFFDMLAVAIAGVGKFFVDIFGDAAAKADAAANLDNAIANLEASERDAERLADLMDPAKQRELDAAMIAEIEARNESTQSLKELNEELTNLPSGFRKLRQRQFEAQRPNTFNRFAGILAGRGGTARS